MRSISLLALGMLACAGACSRPTLYYPVSDPAPARAPEPSHPNGAAATPALTGTASGLSDADYLMYRRILLPVAGADMAKVEDSFNDGRDGGERTHRAIDILAPRGTPILSADDGKILRM